MKGAQQKHELARHARLVRESHEALAGEELRVAIDIAYEAIQKENGRINFTQLQSKNRELEIYLLSKAEYISKWA
jgi:hypothetical protein